MPGSEGARGGGRGGARANGLRKGVQKIRKLAGFVSKNGGEASGSAPSRPASPPSPELQQRQRQRGRRPDRPPPAPQRRLRSRRLATAPPEEQQVEQEEEVLMHPGFFHRAGDGCSSGDMYESDAEEGEGDEREEGDESLEDEDSRRWEPPGEGEEFVEPDPALCCIEPGSLPIYQRGNSSLPDLKDWHRMAGDIVLIAGGDKSFKYKDDVKPPRAYSSILGCLVRKNFPGFVPLPSGGESIAWTWRHYSYAPDPDGDLDNAQERVLHDFWEYFVPDPDHRNICFSMSRAVATKQVQDMHYEGRVGCVRNWYAEKRKIPITKLKAREIFMEPWQYLQVPPQYVGCANTEVFTAMVRYWTSKEFRKKHDDGVKRRGEMKGGCHRQGSLTIVGHIQKEKRETGVEPSVFTVWSKKRTLSEPDPARGGSMWVNDGNELRSTSYCNKFLEVHGPDVDPLVAPFDPEVAVLVGQGKRNGRLWIGDGSVDTATIPSIRQLRCGRKSTRPRIETCPTPLSVAMDRIQARVEEEARLRKEAEAKAQQLEEQMTQQQEQMTQQQQQLTHQMMMMMDWMTAKMASYDAQLTASQPEGVTFTPVGPPPFTFSRAHPSSGSNNVPLGGLGNQEKNPLMHPIAGPHIFDNQNVARK